MQKWLDLLTPSAAALSLLLAIALLVQAVRHGRAVRRLESRLAEREGAAARVSLDRIAQLQRRSKTSSLIPAAAPAGPRRGPNPVTLGVVAAVVAVILAAGWLLFLRGDGSGSASTGSKTTTTTTPTPTQPAVLPSTQVPDKPEALPQGRSFYTVLVLNGSQRQGAAANIVVPYVEGTLGWHAAKPGNAPSSNVIAKSFVIWLPGKEVVADNLAKDLGITKKEPLDGFEIPADQVSDVDAIVIVGTDLATRLAP